MKSPNFATMIKYAGIIVISCAISLFGAIKASEVNQKTKLRAEILRLICHIEAGIKYGSFHLSEIFGSFKSDLLEKNGFMTEIRSGCTDTGKIIESTLSALSTEEKTKLSQFFSQLGKSYCREEEISLCKYYISSLKSIYEANEKKDKAKAVLYKKLGIICALLTAIILF